MAFPPPPSVFHYDIHSHHAIRLEDNHSITGDYFDEEDDHYNTRGDHFKIEFDVDVHNLPPLDPELPIITPPYRFFFTIPCQRLLQDLPPLIRSNLSSLLSHDNLSSLTRRIISHAQSMVENRPGTSNTTYSMLFPLSVELRVCFPSEREEALDRFMQLESIQQFQLVPTTKEAIVSLIKKVKVVNDEGEAKQCSICLEKFEDCEDVSAMPCDHIYHNECIVKWLKTRHTCPLCRYQMPVK